MSLGGQIGNIIAANYKDGSTGNVPFDPSAGIGEFERRQFLPYTQGVVTPQRSAGIGEFERRQFLPDNQLSPTLPPDFIPLPGPDFSPMPRQAVGGATPALPPDFIPLPGPDFSPMPNPPSGGMNSADPYSQIMGQMGYGSDPYSQIMSQMPVRQNPYAYSSGGAIGGYDPRLYNNAFVGSNSRLNLSGLLGGGGMGGGGGGGSDYNGGPNQYVQNETFAQQSARNQQLNDFLTGLTKMSPTGLLMSGFNTLFGSQAPAPVENAGGYGGYIGTPSYESGIGIPGESLANEARDQFDANQGAAVGGDVGSISDQNTGGDGGGYGGYGGDSAGSDSFGGGEYNMGGPVDRVGGPNPPGPDDGAGMLQLGEYVIKKSAVKKYGQGLLDMINDGKIPAKKMKSLLG